MNTADWASIIVVAFLAFKEWRTGARSTDVYLVQLLNETIEAQTKRITVLEETVSRLVRENRELRITLGHVMGLRARRVPCGSTTTNTNTKG